MLRLLADEQAHGEVVRGLLRHPGIDLVRVQDVGLSQTADTIILEWAATENRVLITRDRQTMIGFACARVDAGDPMVGLLVLRPNANINKAIEDVLLVAECASEEEMRGQIRYIPLS